MKLCVVVLVAMFGVSAVMSATIGTADLVGLNTTKAGGRIVGGFPIDISQVPWQVSLRKYGSHFCGASIIGEKWLLTAAHCTEGIRWAALLSARIGSSNNNQGGTVYKVKRIIQHEKFDPRTMDFDFSLLELTEEIEFNENARAIALANEQDEIEVDTICLVTGWGDTLTSESRSQLRGAKVPIFNRKKCNTEYLRSPLQQGITPRMMCAGYYSGHIDSCQGDSGGPLATTNEENNDFVLVGVVSWGYKCALSKYPGVYSRVEVARKWIRKHSDI